MNFLYLHVCQNHASLAGNVSGSINVGTGTFELLPLATHLLQGNISNVFRLHTKAEKHTKLKVKYAWKGVKRVSLLYKSVKASLPTN
jgi:hypothetical protein